MNVTFLFSLPRGLVQYEGAKNLLADAAAFPLEPYGGKDAVSGSKLFLGCDPEGEPLGSGGGTVHLLHECYLSEQRHRNAATKESFVSWLRMGDNDGRIIVHAGGLSRRLPAYATVGKALLPLPPCRWCRGSQLSRTLLSTQVPLFRSIIAAAPVRLRTLVACGDVGFYLSNAMVPLSRFADADVLCFGVRTDPHLLPNHGVLFMSRQRLNDLDFMMQKPSLEEVRRQAVCSDRSFLLDTGLWLLSDRAVEVLSRKCLGAAADENSAHFEAPDSPCQRTIVRKPLDLYSEFGCALGTNPVRADPDIEGLKAKVVELPHATFLHYGTNRQLISSTAKLQRCESPSPSLLSGAPFDGLLTPERSESKDMSGAPAEAHAKDAQDEPNFATGDAMPLLMKPSTAIIHNAVVLAPLYAGASAATAAATPGQKTPSPIQCLWVESSWIGASWKLSNWHILTGIPRNNWALTLPEGTCVSVVPVLPTTVGTACGHTGMLYAARPYHIDDAFRGDINSDATIYMGVPLWAWLSNRGFAMEDLYPASHAAEGGVAGALDIYEAALFPVCTTVQQLGDFLYVATLPMEALNDSAAIDPARVAAGQKVWRTQPRVSANDLLRLADVPTMLQNSQYYERRMLTLTLALVAADPARYHRAESSHQGESSSSSNSTSVLAMQSAPLSPLLIELLQQQFFLLDLNRVAQRVVDLRVALPRRSDLMEGWEAGHTGNDSPDLVKLLSDEAKGSSAEWTNMFAGMPGSGSVGSPVPVPTLSQHIISAHYHMFVSRVMALTLEVIEAALPPLSAEEKAERLALLHAPNTEAVHELMTLHDTAAFAALRTAIMSSFPEEQQNPQLGVQLDQIIWGRCPVRLDLAGGWTDTPPYTLLNGGSVINIAVELNGQPPVQVYVRVRKDPTIVLNSIDSGEHLQITSFDEIRTYAAVQNPFSIPKAVLALCGFLPEFCTTGYATLQDQLRARFQGCGLEISLLVAIPTGSGLGTSSVVSGTLLQSLAEFCKLQWDKHIICRLVLLVEQMLTAGGGWQDQYGGLFEALKLVQSSPGLPCLPIVRWMPQNVFTDPRFASCHILYYTGITRVAKSILVEIVRKVFLNNCAVLQLLHEMGNPHTAAMYDAITSNDYKRYARLVHRTWEQKKQLDQGVCNPEIQAIVDAVEPYVWGLTLPGAGGGGYMYLCAKDEKCARQIRQLLEANPPNANARFVEMSVSTTGLQVSRS